METVQTEAMVEAPKLKLFTISTIFVCSILLSPFSGSILMIINLKRLRKLSSALVVAVLNLGYMLLYSFYLKKLEGFVLNLILEVIVSLLFCGYYFYCYFPTKEEYQGKTGLEAAVKGIGGILILLLGSILLAGFGKLTIDMSVLVGGAGIFTFIFLTNHSSNPQSNEQGITIN